MSVEGGLELSADGNISPGGVGVNLGASVAANYGVEYGQSDQLSRSITVKAKEGTRMEHTIQQVEQFETGEAIVVLNGTTYKVPFVFRSDFATELGSGADGVIFVLGSRLLADMLAGSQRSGITTCAGLPAWANIK